MAGTLLAGFDSLKRKEIDIVLCDVKLPDGNGVDFVKEAKSKFPLIEIILLTAYGNIPDGVQAIKNGAFDYITKGNDNGTAHKKSAIKIKEKGTYSFDEIIGHSSVKSCNGDNTVLGYGVDLLKDGYHLQLRY